MKNKKERIAPKNDTFDDEFEDLFSISPKIKRKKYHSEPQDVFYIYDEIGDPTEYIDLIHTLDTAPENQPIHIRLATPGGRVDSMIAILHAIKRTDALVVTHADADVASAGTYLFLAGTQLCVYPHSTFMFHTVSSMQFGKLQENRSSLDSITRQTERLCQEYLYPVLSTDEIDEMNEGKDFYFDSEEMIVRLDNIKKLMDEMEQEEEEEAKQPKKKPRAKRK